MLKLVVPLMALCLAAPVFNAAPAFAEKAQFELFSVNIPDGWESSYRRGVHFLMDEDDHGFVIHIDEDRNEPLMESAGEHEFPIIDLGEVVGGEQKGSRYIAAKGDSGVLLQIKIDNDVLKQAPEIIKSMKADEDFPELQKAFDKISSKKALDFLKRTMEDS